MRKKISYLVLGLIHLYLVVLFWPWFLVQLTADHFWGGASWFKIDLGSELE